MGLYQGDKPLSAGKSPVAYAKDAGYAGTDTNFYTALADMPDHISDAKNPHGTTASQVGAYTKDETDTLLQKKADLGEDGKVPAGQVDAYSKSESISAETRTALSLAETATPDAALAEIARQLSESKGVSMELLWENASPSSNFAAQTVSVPAFNGYTGYAVLFAEANDARLANTRTTFAPVGKTVILEVATTNTSDKAVRSCSNSETNFIFGDPVYNGVAGAVATVIPLKIYGVNGMFE